MNCTKEISRKWSEITDLVHGSPYTTDELRDHVSEVRIMLKSDDELKRGKALKEIVSMCHPKYLGDNLISAMGSERWNSLLATTKLRAEEIEAGITEQDSDL